jgi:2-phosphosulfolactate phosphatase
MGEGGTEASDEDEACARYIAARLTGTPTDVAAIVASLWAHEDPKWPEWFPRRDAELACEVDRFDFALPVAREGGLLVARPLWSR